MPRKIRTKPPQKDPSGVLAAIIKEVPDGSTFALPAELCDPVFSSEANGPAMRMLMAMIWFSSPYLKFGMRGRVFVSLADLRFAAGLEGHRNNKVVRKLAEILMKETYTLSEKSGSMPVFESVEFFRKDDVESAIWTMSQAFTDHFVSPDRFALLDIVDLRKMQSGVDLSLYRLVRLSWNKNDRRIFIPMEKAARIAGMAVPQEVSPEEEAPRPEAKRVVEKIKRAIARLCERMDINLELTPRRTRGSRFIRDLCLVPSERNKARKKAA